MRDEAICFAEAICKWVDSHEQKDKLAVSALARKVAKLQTTDLPSGAYGLALLRSRDVAVGWLESVKDGMHNEVLFQWAIRLDLVGMVGELVLHGEGLADEPPPLTDNDAGLLEAMLTMGATADSPCSSRVILAQAKWVSEGKRAFDRLKQAGYVASQKGVGFYLTQSGIDRAKGLGT